MTSITINAAGDHQYTPEALQVCIGRIWDCGDAAVSAEQAAQAIGRPVSMVRAAIGYGIKTGELVLRPDGRVEFARTVPSDKPAGMTRAEKRKRRAGPVFRGSIGAAYAVLCEAPTWKIDDLSDRLDYTRLQTLKLLGRLKEQGLAANTNGEWRPVAVLTPDQLNAIRKMFPAHRALIQRILSAEYVTHRELDASQRDTAKLLVRRGLLATTERRGLLAYELTPLCVECLPVIKAHE